MKYKLTDTALKASKIKPSGKPAKYTDGGGLYLFVMTSGKYWRYDYTNDEGKRKTLAIGVYPDISLKTARERHQRARELLANGVDPSSHKQSLQAAQVAITENSFESVAREWLIKFSSDWVPDHTNKITRRLEMYIFPWLGSRPIGEIEPPEILECLRRIEARGTLETAHRTKQSVGQVFRYAVSIGKAKRDQTADLKGAIPPAKGKNFAAITDPQEIGALMRGIEGYNGTLITVIALKLSAYLFTRPSELRMMEWAELDIASAQWHIPAERMKARNEHSVPLPRQALALLEELRPLTGGRRYVFQSMTDSKKAMSNNTVRQALRRMGYSNEEMTAHGFRALASTTLHEMGFDSELIERQLAHAVGNEVRRAYDRSKHIERRAAMMQQWANYLDSLRDGAQVLPFMARTA